MPRSASIQLNVLGEEIAGGARSEAAQPQLHERPDGQIMKLVSTLLGAITDLKT